jgi:hypothetical protein
VSSQSRQLNSGHTSKSVQTKVSVPLLTIEWGLVLIPSIALSMLALYLLRRKFR